MPSERLRLTHRDAYSDEKPGTVISATRVTDPQLSAVTAFHSLACPCARAVGQFDPVPRPQQPQQPGQPHPPLAVRRPPRHIAPAPHRAARRVRAAVPAQPGGRRHRHPGAHCRRRRGPRARPACPRRRACDTGTPCVRRLPGGGVCADGRPAGAPSRGACAPGARRCLARLLRFGRRCAVHHSVSVRADHCGCTGGGSGCALRADRGCAGCQPCRPGRRSASSLALPLILRVVLTCLCACCRRAGT